VFDENFREKGPKLDWNGNEGLTNLWGNYYWCPDAEFIQRALAAHVQQDPSNLRVMHHSTLANNNKHDSLSTATPSSTSLICSALRNPASSDTYASGMRSNDLQSYLSMCGADLQAKLDNH
jgi:hypothetical protein